MPLAVAESLAITFAAIFCILILVLSGRAGVQLNRLVSNPAHYQVALVLAALLLFVPIISAIQGYGGGASSAPLSQGNQLVTPSGTSTLILTPSANSNSSKALQLSPIQLTLVVN